MSEMLFLSFTHLKILATAIIGASLLWKKIMNENRVSKLSLQLSFYSPNCPLPVLYCLKISLLELSKKYPKSLKSLSVPSY